MLSEEEHDGRRDVQFGHLATDTHIQFPLRSTDDMIIVKGSLLKNVILFVMYATVFIHPVKTRTSDSRETIRFIRVSEN